MIKPLLSLLQHYKDSTATPRTNKSVDDWLFQEEKQIFLDLAQRVDIALNGQDKRSVMLLASTAEEGVSSIAHAYAQAASQIRQRRILLISMKTEDTASGPFLMDHLKGNFPLQSVTHAVSSAFWTACLHGKDTPDAEVVSLLTEGQWLKTLLRVYDEIVIDSPSVASSPVGLLLAPHADGVVVIVAAEKTRAPVVQRLLYDLNKMKANVLGTILNRRKFYIPEKIYRLL